MGRVPPSMDPKITRLGLVGLGGVRAKGGGVRLVVTPINGKGACGACNVLQQAHSQDTLCWMAELALLTRSGVNTGTSLPGSLIPYVDCRSGFPTK